MPEETVAVAHRERHVGADAGVLEHTDVVDGAVSGVPDHTLGLKLPAEPHAPHQILECCLLADIGPGSPTRPE